MSESTQARRTGRDLLSEGALEARREDILKILSLRFHWEIDEHKAELTEGLKRIDDDDRLRPLLEYALRCIDLFHFRQSLLPSSKRAARIDPETRREIIADWVRQHFNVDLGVFEDSLAMEKHVQTKQAMRDAIVKVVGPASGPTRRRCDPS